MYRKFYYSALAIGVLSFQSIVFAADVFKTEAKPAPPAKQLVVVPPSDSAFEDWTRCPYIERAPQIVPTAEEKKLGCVIFSRPLVDAIYPETIPYAQERISKLDGFGAWNQFETVNFAIYPLTDLTNINVRVGDLVCGKDKIPSRDIAVRLVTYRDNAYPRYSSKGAWRRLPEYLQPVTTSDAPAKEPQRFCLTVKVPENISGGVYTGKILVSHDAFDQAIVLPIRFRVLPFKPLRDPNKGFNAYYHLPWNHELVLSKKQDQAWAEDVLEREIATMASYGHNRFPVIAMSMKFENDKPRFVIDKIDKYVELMKKNGMTGPMIIVGGGISRLYSRITKKKIEWIRSDIPGELPPEEFFRQLEEAARELAREIKEKNYPDIYFGPLDEIPGNEKSIEYSSRLYEALRKGGLKTYTTMEPENPGFAKMDPHVDVFSSQVFSPSYDEIQKRHKVAYYCYPNHNSFERKDPVIMCKGGRMTYGFGYWRSGFDTLIPYIWRLYRSTHFTQGSGGGNILHPETGDVIMTTYWENFREGINDLNYIYTLEDAIVKRENSTDPAVQKLVKEGREFLQSIWDSIIVQEKYLNVDLWPSDQFDALRYRMGEMIVQLLKYPPTNDRVAPSVIVDTKSKPKSDYIEEIYREQQALGNLDVHPIENVEAPNFGWSKLENEASVSLVPIEGETKKGVRLHLDVDLINDGTGNKSGKYPAGWPGMAFTFRNKAATLAQYDFIHLKYCVESNRPKSDDPQDIPISCRVSFNGKGILPVTISCPKKGIEGKWLEVFAPAASTTYDGLNTDQAEMDNIRALITERHYKHGDKLDFTFANMEFIKLKKPIIASVEVSPYIIASYGRVRFTAQLLGEYQKGEILKTTLLDYRGQTVATLEQPVPVNKKLTGQLNFDSKIKRGNAQVRFEICDANGKILANKMAAVTVLP